MTLGTWLTVGDLVSKQRLADLVAAALDCGITTLDTADVYGFGAAEEALGDILKDYPEGTFDVFTKIYFSTDPATAEPRGLSAAAVAESADACLRRLKTDCIALLQCHRPDPKVPVAETTAAMEALVQAGKIRWWGVSRWSDAAIDEALSAGGDHLVSRQDPYHLFLRDPERGAFDHCAARGMGFLAYSPLARGVLTGKYRDGVPPGSRASHPEARSTIYDLTPENVARVDRLVEVAADRGCSAAQLALAWCMRPEVVSSVLIGATSVEQLRHNVAAAEIVLSDEELAPIDAAFPL